MKVFERIIKNDGAPNTNDLWLKESAEGEMSLKVFDDGEWKDIASGGGSAEGSVSYEPQELTEEQQIQARKNLDLFWYEDTMVEKTIVVDDNHETTDETVIYPCMYGFNYKKPASRQEFIGGKYKANPHYVKIADQEDYYRQQEEGYEPDPSLQPIEVTITEDMIFPLTVGKDNEGYEGDDPQGYYIETDEVTAYGIGPSLDNLMMIVGDGAYSDGEESYYLLDFPLYYQEEEETIFYGYPVFYPGLTHICVNDLRNQKAVLEYSWPQEETIYHSVPPEYINFVVIPLEYDDDNENVKALPFDKFLEIYNLIKSGVVVLFKIEMYRQVENSESYYSEDVSYRFFKAQRINNSVETDEGNIKYGTYSITAIGYGDDFTQQDVTREYLDIYYSYSEGQWMFDSSLSSSHIYFPPVMKFATIRKTTSGSGYYLDGYFSEVNYSGIYYLDLKAIDSTVYGGLITPISVVRESNASPYTTVVTYLLPNQEIVQFSISSSGVTKL